MNKNTPVTDVLAKYGLGDYGVMKSSHTPKNVEDGLDPIGLTLALFDVPHQLEVSQAQYQKDRVTSLVLSSIHCRISNAQQWFSSFGIDSSKCALPVDYLKKVNWVSTKIPSRINKLHCNFFDATSLALLMNKTRNEVLQEVSPSFPLLSVFNDPKAEAIGKKEVEDILSNLTSLMDPLKVEKFKSDLTLAALGWHIEKLATLKQNFLD